jgi:hypothetical protein
VIELPRALRPYRRELEAFPLELAAALGKLMHALAPAVDACFRPHDAPEGDVDGFDGLARHGSYERLLASEWALEGVAPLEFLRRAASGEHSFLAFARREPASRQNLSLFFDTGPEQIGGARIVQLALLLLMSQRAAQRRALFGFQMVHHLGEPLLTEIGESSVRHFLLARTALRSSAKAVASWEHAHPSANRWLIGAPALVEGFSSSFTTVALRELTSPDRRAVEVTLRAGRGSLRRVVLDLPEPRLAIRLLRDPFSSAQAPKVSLGRDQSSSNLLLNPQGSRLFYRDQSGALVSQPVPNSARAKPGKRRSFAPPPGSTIVGADGRGKRTLWLAAARGSISLGAAAPLESREPALHAAAPLLEPGEALRPIVYFHLNKMLSFVASDDSLWRVDFPSNASRLIGEDVRALTIDANASLVALNRPRESDAAEPGVFMVRPFQLTPICSTRDLSHPRREFGEVFLRRGLADHFLLAYETETQAFCLETRDARFLLEPDGPVAMRLTGRPAQSELTLHPPRATRVVGVLPRSLLILDAGGEELALVGRSSNRVLARSRSRIVSVASASAAPIFAFATENGEISVVDQSGQRRLWLSPEERG